MYYCYFLEIDRQVFREDTSAHIQVMCKLRPIIEKTLFTIAPRPKVEVELNDSDTSGKFAEKAPARGDA